MGNVKAGDVETAASKLKSQWSSLPGASEETNNMKQTKQIFQQEIIKELNGKSSVKTKQGQLKITE